MNREQHRESIKNDVDAFLSKGKAIKKLPHWVSPINKKRPRKTSRLWNDSQNGVMI